MRLHRLCRVPVGTHADDARTRSVNGERGKANPGERAVSPSAGAASRQHREIAEQLDLTPHTVRHHIDNIFAKLGVHSRRSIAPRFE